MDFLGWMRIFIWRVVVFGWLMPAHWGKVLFQDALQPHRRDQPVPAETTARRRIWVITALSIIVTVSGAAAEPRRVLLLESYGRNFVPFSNFETYFREELTQQSKEPVDFFQVALATARYAENAPQEKPFVEYLRALFTDRPPDLIVTMGAPAARFLRQHRRELFPATPAVLTSLEQRRSSNIPLTGNDAVVSNTIDFPSVIDNVLKVLPQTNNIAVVIGNSPNERFWVEELQREFQLFASRLQFTWFDNLSFDKILKKAAELPPRSAILFLVLSVDAAGIVHQEDETLRDLHAVTNAPIFALFDTSFGLGIVGGPLVPVRYISRQGAEVAVRLLRGEKAGDIKTPAIGFAPPLYDGRELQRWKISEVALPQGSEVRFRPTTMWEQYRWQMATALAVLLLQTAMIIWLIIEHRYRRMAELESRHRMSELAQMNRRAAANELSASIGHEINQPLAAILANASAGLRWLGKNTPDLGEVQAALRRIISDGERGGEIIGTLRTMFRKGSDERTLVDVNDLIRSVIALVRSDLAQQDISVEVDLAGNLPQIFANQVQLQQVILNLAVNAKDALESVSDRARVLRIRSRVHKAEGIVISVEDTGTGIDAKLMNHIFDRLYTTKPTGMGMGLAICRSIVESHGGQLSAMPRLPHGSAFRIVLPIAAKAAA